MQEGETATMNRKIEHRNFRVILLLLATSLVGIVCPCTDAFGQSFDSYIRYDELDQQISLSRLRAGNHDANGTNDYLFSATIYAIAILKEERKKEFEERKKLTRELGDFAATSLTSLSVWNPEADPKKALRIQGDLIRELAAEAMRAFSLPENQIAIMVRIGMIEKNKQFMFFGEDLKVGQVDYYIIPETLPHKPEIKRRTLTITDQHGVFAEFTVTYDKLNQQQARN